MTTLQNTSNAHTAPSAITAAHNSNKAITPLCSSPSCSATLESLQLWKLSLLCEGRQNYKLPCFLLLWKPKFKALSAVAENCG